MDRKEAREKLIGLFGETRQVYDLLREAKNNSPFRKVGISPDKKIVNVKYDSDGFQVWEE